MEWIKYDDTKLKCPNCEVIHLIYSYPPSAGANYCPNCGVKLDMPNLAK